MDIKDKLRRYFIGNRARVFSIRRRYPAIWSRDKKVIPWRCGNARGYFWMGWEISWRLPYADVWHWNAESRSWEPRS